MLICSVIMKKGGTEAGLRQECDKKEKKSAALVHDGSPVVAVVLRRGWGAAAADGVEESEVTPNTYRRREGALRRRGTRLKQSRPASRWWLSGVQPEQRKLDQRGRCGLGFLATW
jgi:type II secretory pathway component PulJ